MERAAKTKVSMFKKLFTTIHAFAQRYPLLVISIFFVLVNVIFNWPFLKEIIRNPINGTYGEDTVLLHYFAENAYRLLLQGQNPFQFNANIFYPFGTSTVLGETGIINAFYFLVLRNFLYPYAALLAVVCINLFLCQLVMYALLRYLKIDRFLSAIFAVVYAFAPFVSVRIQYHYNYVYHFLFALITLLLLQVIYSKGTIKRVFYSIALGLAGALLFYNTLYYVAIYLMFLVFFCGFYAIVYKDQVRSKVTSIIQSWKYLAITLITFLILLSPFIIQLNTVFKISEVKQTQGWGGAIEFSANALDIVTPSEFNPVVGKKINEKLKKVIPEKQPIEQIIYPGILVLIGLALFLRQKKNRFDPLFLTGLSFYILSLGPFLHFYKYWNIRITDTILGVIPLPYILLKKLPLFSMMRAPVRFSIMISFVGVLIAAFALQKYFKNNPARKIFIFPILIVLFFVDQYYIPQVKPADIQLPLKSYELIKKDQQSGPIMEIPNVIQDGFFYWGKVFNSYPMVGQLVHGKPILGGYLARVPDYMFSYYMQNPFLGYYGFLGDDRRKNPEAGVKKPTYTDMKESLNFLDIKYLLVKEDLPTFKEIEKDFAVLGFKKQLTNDAGYTLFTRKPEAINKTTYDLQKPYEIGLFGDWSKPEKTLRWLDGNYAGFFVKKADSRTMKLEFEALAYKVPRTMDIFINRVFIKEIIIDTVPKTYSVELTHLEANSLNKVEMKLKNAALPKKQPGEDNRNLSIAFSSLLLK